jgi:hypothetical protein
MKAINSAETPAINGWQSDFLLIIYYTYESWEQNQNKGLSLKNYTLSYDQYLTICS